MDWIEANANRIYNVSNNWGHLAAVCFFNWQRAEKWLALGRPLSLIALDALIFCTTTDGRLNQSLLMRELNPTLPDKPKPDVIANTLYKYLQTDNEPRTKMSVNAIIRNIFEVEK